MTCSFKHRCSVRVVEWTEGGDEGGEEGWIGKVSKNHEGALVGFGSLSDVAL